MNIAERVVTAMRWGEPDRIPLTIYDWMMPRGATERRLRAAGLGLVTRLPAHLAVHREVEIVSRKYVEAGRRLVRRTIKTPVGEVWQTLEAEGAYDTSNWIKEHFIKGPDDYRVMEFYYRDAVYADNYAAIRESQRRLGDDGITIARVAKSPIQEMLYQLMGYEQFAVDFHHNREQFDSLHTVMSQRYAELYELAAGAPVEIVHLGDNIASDVVGGARFRQYLMPEYAKIHRRIQGTGKLLAVHMDGHLRSLTEAIGQAEIDIIEALTPPPMGDVSLAQARQAWPGKALWLNCTSSMHIEPPEIIEAHTRELLAQWGGKAGLAIGVTEDAPMEALERGLGVIARVLAEA